MRASCLLLIACALAFAADDPYAAALFQKNCATCHQAGGEAAARIPQIAVLKSRTPNSILRALEGGVMKQQAAVLSTNERQAVANWLGTSVTLERRPSRLVAGGAVFSETAPRRRDRQRRKLGRARSAAGSEVSSPLNLRRPVGAGRQYIALWDETGPSSLWRSVKVMRESTRSRSMGPSSTSQ